jgi:hypothetical protein
MASAGGFEVRRRGLERKEEAKMKSTDGNDGG